MAEQIQGFGDINYGGGTGWLDYYNLLSQMLTQQGASQAATGTSVLDTLGGFLTSPTAGPLGLAATAAYGNPQGIAAATGGKGIDNSGYTSRFDKVLDDLLGYTGNINKTADDIPMVDPNKAPSLTPENAAKAPNAAKDWITAWQAYNPGQRHPDASKYGMQMGGILNRMLGGKVPGYAGGGNLDLSTLDDGSGGDNPLQGLEGLASGADKWVKAGGKSADYWKTIQQVGRLAGDVQKFLTPDEPGPVDSAKQRFFGGDSPREKAAGNVGSALGVGGDAVSDYLSQYSNMVGPDPTYIAQQLLQQFGPQAQASGLWLPRPQGLQDGGVTLAGRPHFIVDDNGYPVAQITEDGAPENVRGTDDGQVEVTPLQPDRFENYTGQDAAESDLWGRMLARMESGTPGAATGAKFMFPDAPNSLVDTSPEPGTNQIPSFGGPSTGMDRGTPYSGGQPKSIEDLFRSVQGAPGSNYNERYASLLGGALSGNTTMGDASRALNAGRAPEKLPSAQQWGTMTPSQRAGYTAMLQQMGIIQSPEDLAFYIDRFRPDGLG